MAQQRRKFDATWLPFGMSIGIAIGIGTGLVVFGNIFAGAGVGFILGAAIGIALGTAGRRQGASDEEIEDREDEEYREYLAQHPQLREPGTEGHDPTVAEDGSADESDKGPRPRQ